MVKFAFSSTLAGLALLPQFGYGYDVLKDYSGIAFFDEWDFYGFWDNLTLGDVWWLDQQDATSQSLAYVNTAGNAIMRVDNSTNVANNEKRNSVRITTQDSFALGTLWMIDAVHLPFGCSVWPAFWAKGPLWPNDGEIDIIEGINLLPANQMALHTLPGCFHTTPPDQLGTSAGTGNNGMNGGGQNASDCSTASGCVVTETKNASYGSAFAENGGGVWATQFDVSGIFMWYWPRAQLPPSVQSATPTSSMDLSDWGSPSASFPSTSCNMSQFFSAQQLVLDITLCGVWAGVPSIYNATCMNEGPTGMCYTDNVVGPGSPKYDDAYFEIQYVRVYGTQAAIASASTSASSSPTEAADSNSTSTTSSPSGGTSSATGASSQRNALSALLLLTCWMMSLLASVV